MEMEIYMETGDDTIRVYLAAPLFSLIERSWNRRFAKALQKALPGSNVVLPQDFKVAGDYNDKRHWSELFRRCIEEIDGSHAVVAVVDGADTDSGTAFEMGYAYKAGIPVIAIRTDFRQNQDRGVNIMISHSASEFVLRMSFDEAIEDLAQDIASRILKAIRTGRERS